VDKQSVHVWVVVISGLNVVGHNVKAPQYLYVFREAFKRGGCSEKMPAACTVGGKIKWVEKDNEKLGKTTKKAEKENDKVKFWQLKK
jgi:hypothetical protein